MDLFTGPPDKLHAMPGVIFRFNPDFLKERKAHLQRYLDAVLALPSALESREVRQFFEVRPGREIACRHGGSARPGVMIIVRHVLSLF